jgi:large subunit ribosomal protein L29
MVTSLEISEYDIEELETQLSETRRELFNLRFQLATGRLDNFSRLNHVRKDVARMMTELRAREIAEAEGLAEEEIPAHRAAARLRSEDAALGRTRTTAADRRAAARAEAEAAEAGEEIDDDDDLQLQQELEDTDDDQALARAEESDAEDEFDAEGEEGELADDAAAEGAAADQKKKA